jgi:hypothetical protein
VSLDLYLYARLNPERAVDPLGLVSSSQIQCVLLFSLAGSVGTAIAGGGVAALASGGVLVIPGAVGGAVIGAIGGAIVGTLVCTDIGTCISNRYPFARTKPWRCTAKCQLMTVPGGLGTGQYIEGR